MVHLASAVTAGLLGLASIVAAHPGHDHTAEAAERRHFMRNAPIQSRSLSQCASKLKARGLEAKNVARRQNAVKQIRRRRGLSNDAQFLKARDLDTLLNTSHASNLTGVTPSTDASVLFGSEATCILAPDVTQGPYYVSGELIRENIVEDQKGVALYMDIQLIDTNTCEPLPDVYMDLWHCNATGVYSGVVASGNGDSSDATNLDATFLRGIQPSNAEGVVQFESIFPGYYTGRTVHIHVLTHPANETTVLQNNTISGLYSSKTSHVGQLFFDQDLITKVNEVSPYSANTQTLTTNADDSILSEEAETIDPFMEYVLLGDDLSDGIFAWISVGVDSTEDTSVNAAAYYTEQGGVENESSGMGGGSGGGGSPPGASSSGPSGSRPTSA
ncbi:extracellular dioxygenase [Penicillium brasilianum]|uniref:Extracellular dioxygenase n=1 Tax=Penicillium brasilianum TaxID=104259 RepID=A0A1S9R9E4_PENBI|nr:extracellular dioxygenase [Penicillium brasilianum]